MAPFQFRVNQSNKNYAPLVLRLDTLARRPLQALVLSRIKGTGYRETYKYLSQSDMDGIDAAHFIRTLKLITRLTSSNLQNNDLGELSKPGGSRYQSGGNFFNQIGPIPLTYYETHNIGALEKAEQAFTTTTASYEGSVRVVFQSMEIALHSLIDIYGSMLRDLKTQDIVSAARKAPMLKGFGSLAQEISRLPGLLGGNSGEAVQIISLRESPTYQSFIDLKKEFDQVFQTTFSEELLTHVLALGGVENPILTILNSISLSDHALRVADRNLQSLSLPIQISSYEEFISVPLIARAFQEPELNGDTLLPQFKALHQIPELFGQEINQRLEKFIELSRSEDFPQQTYEALKLLHSSFDLFNPLIQSIRVLAENMTYSQFRLFRENLGVTSGSESRLVKQLFRTVSELGQRVVELTSPESKLDAEFQNLLTEDAIRIWNQVESWRDAHMNLPRLQIGTNRSISSSAGPSKIDSVQQTANMQKAAARRNPLQTVLSSRGLSSVSNPSPGCSPSFTGYIQGDSSLDYLTLQTLGKLSNDFFGYMVKDPIFALIRKQRQELEAAIRKKS